MNLKKLEKVFGEWDDGYYDPFPKAFRRFSKGLYNLMSFTVETVQAYDLVKSQDLKTTLKPVISLKPVIIEDYFKTRLFELGYLGAWAAFETYLRDVIWLKLSEVSKPIATEIVNKNWRISDIFRIYKRLLNIDLRKIPEVKKLFKDKERRNKLAHSGKSLGYTSYFESDKYRQDHVEYAAVKEETAITEEIFCQILVDMWKIGDFLRQKFFKTRSP